MDKLREQYQKLSVTAKASIWFLLCSFLQKGINTIVTPIFTRILTSSEFGLYSVYDSWKGIAGAIVTLNLAGGMFMQGLVKFDREQNVFISSMQSLGLALCSVWYCVYLVNADFWNGLFSLSFVQMSAMFFTMWSDLAISFWMVTQRVRYRYQALVLVILLSTLAKPILGIILVHLSDDHVTARIMGAVIVNALICPVLFAAQMLRGKRFFSKKYWPYALRFTIPLIPHYLSQIMLSNADRIMIRDMVGADKAGIYSLAYSVSLIMTLFNTALLQAISPWMYQKIKDGAVQELPRAAYATMAATAVLNLLLMLMAPEIVRIFAPIEYYEAVWVIPPVSMSVFFIFSYDFFACFEFYYEKTSFIMVSSLLASVCNILLNYIFIQQFGFIAAGYTTLLCYMLYAFAHYVFMNQVAQRYFPGVKIYHPAILLGLAAAFLASGFVLLLTYRFTMMRYGVGAAAVVIILVKREQIMNGIHAVLKMRRGQ